MSTEFLLLNNLDKPVKIAFFTVVEFSVIFMMLTLGILTQYFISSIFILIVGFVLYRKFFQNFTNGAFKEKAYFELGIGEGELHYKLPSHYRRMIG